MTPSRNSVSLAAGAAGSALYSWRRACPSLSPPQRPFPHLVAQRLCTRTHFPLVWDTLVHAPVCRSQAHRDTHRRRCRRILTRHHRAEETAGSNREAERVVHIPATALPERQPPGSTSYTSRTPPPALCRALPLLPLCYRDCCSTPPTSWPRLPG